MAMDSVASLIDAIHQARLLEPGQMDELIERLQVRYQDPEELGQVLVEKGWLSAEQYQKLQPVQTSSAARPALVSRHVLRRLPPLKSLRPPIQPTTLLIGVVVILMSAGVVWLAWPWFRPGDTRSPRTASVADWAIEEEAEPAPLQPMPEPDAWTPLLNGKDLDGWRTWLGKPEGEGDVIGFDRDTKQVFHMVKEDDRPALRISGEIVGFLTTRRAYENYHLRLEFKWGPKKWPPYDSRQGGLIYHGAELPKAGGRLAGLECRLATGQTGSLTWTPEANFSVEVEGKLVPARRREEGMLVQYQAGGQLFSVPLAVPPWIVRAADHERPAGQWNTLEILTVDGNCVHRVNGHVNLAATNAQRWLGLKPEPLRRGKIQLKSEGAELFIRDLAIRPLDWLPD